MNLLEALHPEGITGHLGIFTLPDAKTKWFTDAAKAFNHAIKITDKNVYFTICTMGKDLGPFKKGTEEDAVSMPCLWIDIDYLGPNHKNKDLPPTKEDAVWLIKNTLPENYQPSIVTFTGGGLQGYWIFKEEWTFETEEDKKEAKNLIVRFNALFKRKASEYGWDVDSTTSLAQIFRVPGTLNVKGTEAVKTEIMESSETRYNPDDFETILPEIESRGLYQERENLNIILLPDANPNKENFQLLMDMDDLFEATWEKRRKDKSMRDKSLSGYDYALANIALNYGWSDQEIANLIVAFRRKHSVSEKDLKKSQNLKYISDTINNARETRKKNQYDKFLQDVPKQSAKYQPTKELKDAKTLKEKMLVSLSHSLGIDISKFIKYSGDNPEYVLVLRDGKKINIGSTTNLYSFSKFQQQIMGQVNVLVNSKKKDEWFDTLGRIMAAIDEIDPGFDARSTGIITSYLKDYWNQQNIDDDIEAILANKTPFTRDSKKWIFLQHFKEFLTLNGEKYNTKELGMIIAQLDGYRKTLGFKKEDGTTTTRSAYDVTNILDVAEAMDDVDKTEKVPETGENTNHLSI